MRRVRQRHVIEVDEGRVGQVTSIILSIMLHLPRAEVAAAIQPHFGSARESQNSPGIELADWREWLSAASASGPQSSLLKGCAYASHGAHRCQKHHCYVWWKGKICTQT